MKRFLMFVLCMFSLWACANPANAQVRIGITLNAPGVIFNDTEQLEKLDNRLAELLPTDKYEVLPVQVLIQKEKEYRRNKNIFQAPNQLTPQPLSMEALCE